MWRGVFTFQQNARHTKSATIDYSGLIEELFENLLDFVYVPMNGMARYLPRIFTIYWPFRELCLCAFEMWHYYPRLRAVKKGRP